MLTYEDATRDTWATLKKIDKFIGTNLTDDQLRKVRIDGREMCNCDTPSPEVLVHYDRVYRDTKVNTKYTLYKYD